MTPRAITLSLSLVLVLLLTPALSHGQQPGKVYRIGYLGLTMGGSYETDTHRCPVPGNPNWQAWLEGLRDRGYVVGQNLLLECRYTEGHEERAPALAAELVSLNPDLLVAVAAAASVVAAKAAAPATPIVMVNVVDPVGRGLVASLAHPGGTVTGMAWPDGAELAAKQLQHLKEALPQVSRVAILSFVSSVPAFGFQQAEEAAARTLQITVERYSVRAPEELADAFAAMSKAEAQALVTESWAFMSANRDRIVALAAQHRLPAMYNTKLFVDAGGLMSYAPNEPAIWRQLGDYVDKIFHGANPGDLPMELPAKLDLAINLTTAKALELTIPQSVLNQAVQVQ